jgi:uncharacterized membrane protein YccF (DUF307 family)
MRLLWIVLVGWWAALLCYTGALLCAITIIGIPAAGVMIKLGGYAFDPFR